MKSALARASAYLIDSREDGHESAQHRSTDAGDVNKRALEGTERKNTPDTNESHSTFPTKTSTIVSKTGSLNWDMLYQCR